MPFAALLGWAAAHQRLLARALLAFAIACAAINVYFLPGSSYYHKDLYGPFTPRQREAYIGVTAPIRNVIAWFNRAHPQAAVLLTQDSDIAGLGGDVYENHWHQYNTLDKIRRAPECARPTRIAGPLERPLPDRAQTHRQPLRPPPGIAGVARSMHHRGICVWRILCRPPGTRLPRRCDTSVGAGDDRQPGIYDDFDPSILLRGDWERADEFEQAFRHTVTFTDIVGAEIRFAFEGSELTYVFTRAANRGIAAVTIDGAAKGTIDLYSVDPEWQSSVVFTGLGAGRHLLVIRVTGESRAGSTGKYVDLDALKVN